MPSRYAARIFFVPAVLLIFLAPAANAGLFGLSNYDECITESMKGVNSDVAARAIIQACRKRFPQPKTAPAAAPAEPAIEALPDDALRRLDATLTVQRLDGGFLGDLYNGTHGWHVTELTIGVWQKNNESERRYRIKVSAAPLTTDIFEFRPFEWDKSSKWGIVAARGHRAQ